mgnify:CR=1 FL=1
MKTNVYIVIVTYNGLKWLSKCLKSCAPYPVIVVDNNSSDDTVSFIQSNFPQIIIIRQDHNLGFGAANNIGISHALKLGAEYVFLLNQDAYLDTNTIEVLINAHKANTNYGILSPIHLNGEGTELDNNFSKYIQTNNDLQNDVNQKSYSKEIYEVPFVNAAAWLLPKNTIETIGGFDPVFFHRGEDDNYCQRVLFHNLKVGIVHKVHVRHDREFREKPILKNQAQKLVHYERSLKQDLANINIEIEGIVRKKKQIIIKTVLKSLLKLRINEAFLNIRKYKRLMRVLPEIETSRRVNREIDLHHLEK